MNEVFRWIINGSMLPSDLPTGIYIYYATSEENLIKIYQVAYLYNVFLNTENYNIEIHVQWKGRCTLGAKCTNFRMFIN